MIGFFSDPYPDELLYSVVARYHERTGYRSKDSTCRDLFGATRAAVAIDLPCRIDALVSVLPPGHVHRADKFIERNTLLPLFAPFMPPDRLSLLRQDMRGASGGSIHGRLGILTSNILVEFFRYCPGCVEADRGEFGEAYWHRLHQAPGVEVCLAHKVLLENSHLRARKRSKAEGLVTAERVVGVAPPPRQLDEAHPTHRAYLKIAEDVHWLLTHPDLGTSSSSYRNRYVPLLGGAGLSTPAGKVKTADLVDAVINYYSPEFLKSLGCGPGGKKYYWIQRLAQNHGKAQHPLHHLLLMQFLGTPAADFFRLVPKPKPTERPPFGEGPWPCLNRAADHYGQPVIAECRISRCYNTKRPRAMFRCECGFTYVRLGPDLSEHDRYVIGRYVTYGKVWEAKLKEMYREGKSQKIIAAGLGVSTCTVLKHAKLLGLRISSGSNGVAAAGGDVKIDLREKHRRAWLEARETFPGAGRSALAANFSTTHNWLRFNDTEWLRRNSPERLPHKGAQIRVDWPKRDVEFSEAVRREAQRLKNSPGRPVRVTASGVASALGCLTMIRRRRDLLPLTIKTLTEVSESVEEIAVRRVEWAARVFRGEGIRPNISEFLMRVGTTTDVAKRPQVEAAINAALLSIQPSERATAKLPTAA